MQARLADGPPWSSPFGPVAVSPHSARLAHESAGLLWREARGCPAWLLVETGPTSLTLGRHLVSYLPAIPRRCQVLLQHRVHPRRRNTIPIPISISSSSSAASLDLPFPSAVPVGFARHHTRPASESQGSTGEPPLLSPLRLLTSPPLYPRHRANWTTRCQATCSNNHRAPFLLRKHHSCVEQCLLSETLLDFTPTTQPALLLRTRGHVPRSGCLRLCCERVG